MYVCTKTCFVGWLVREGDVVNESTASLAPSCFSELEAKTPKAQEKEIEEKVPVVAKRKQAEKKQPISATDIVKKKVKIAGE